MPPPTQPLGDQTQFQPGNVGSPGAAAQNVPSSEAATPALTNVVPSIAQLLAALGNIQRTVSVTPAPAPSLAAQGVPFATILGTAVRVFVSVTGFTSGAGDVVLLSITIDGVTPIGPAGSIVPPPSWSVNSGNPGLLFTVNGEFIFAGLVPGATHQYGYVIKDNSGGTINQSANGGYIQVEEIP